MLGHDFLQVRCVTWGIIRMPSGPPNDRRPSDGKTISTVASSRHGNLLWRKICYLDPVTNL